MDVGPNSSVRFRMYIRLVSLAIATGLLPPSSNAAEKPDVSWWVGEGASFSVNDVAANFSEWWGIAQAGGRACAINYGSMFGQESALLFEGSSRNGVMRLSYVKAIRGSYSPGFGPIDPRSFYRGATTLVQALSYQGEARPRIAVLAPAASAMFSAYDRELEQECSSRLTSNAS